MQRSSIDRRAFTLIELLVVISIVGILVALLLPAVQAAREAARRAACLNRLKQLSIGAQNHHDHHGVFPPGGTIHITPGQPGVSWRVLILPFIEEGLLHDRIDPQPNGGAAAWLTDEMPTAFTCPSEDRGIVVGGAWAKSNYDGVGGVFRVDEGTASATTGCGKLAQNGALFPGSETRHARIVDGSSKTLLLGERVYVFSDWMPGALFFPGFLYCSPAAKNVEYPINSPVERFAWEDDSDAPDDATEIKENDLYFGSHHPGGAHFALADSSVHFIDEGIDINAYKALSTIAGEEITDWAP